MPGKDKMFFSQHASWNGVRRRLWTLTVVSTAYLWLAIALQKGIPGENMVAVGARALVWLLVLFFVGAIVLIHVLGRKRKVQRSQTNLAGFFQAKSHEGFSKALATLDKRLKRGNPGEDQVWILLSSSARALFDGVDIEIINKELKHKNPVYWLEYEANYDDQVVYNIDAKGTIRKPMGALRLYYPDPREYSKGNPNIGALEKKLVLWELK